MQSDIHIMVVEDDPDMRTVLTSVLECQGYQVESVGRGAEAVARAREKAFDLVVTDIRMEGMDGLQALEETKKLRPDISSLVVSGYASEADTLRAVSLNVGGYLKKPFPISDFLTQVREILARRMRALEGERERLSARDVLHGVLEALVRLVEDSGRLSRPGLLTQAGTLAGRLAEALHLSPPEVQEVRLAAMLTGVHQECPKAELDRVFGQAPPSVRGLAAGLLEPSPAGELTAQVARLAWEAARSQTADELPPRELLALPSLDPAVAEAYDRLDLQDDSDVLSPGASPEVLSGLQDPARIDRSLLSLALSLEEGGDPDSARKAYEDVLARQVPSREIVVASLALARLAWEQGQPQAPEPALQAIQWARKLGPLAYYSTVLEAGLLLFRMGSPRAQELLEQAVPALQNLGLRGAAARGWIALARLGRTQGLEASLQLLGQPQFAAEVSESSVWLLPEVAHQAALGVPQAGAALGRLMLDQPHQLAALLRKQDLDPAARGAVLDAVEGVAAALPPFLWEALLADPEQDLRQRAVRLHGSHQGQAPPPLLRLFSLGFFRVLNADQPIPEARWKTQKTRYLLAYLATTPGRKYHEDVILEQFWPDDRGLGKKSLYAATTTVRRNLRPEGTEHDYVVRDGEMLSLNWDLPRWHDLEELEKACEAGAKAEAAAELGRAVEHYRRAAQIYLAPYLDGCYMDWAVARREQIQEQALQALGRLACLAADARSYQEALEHSNRILALDPHRQEGHLYRMRATLGLGQPEVAIKQFEACERLLKREYGIEPNMELVEVYHRARNGLPDAASRA